MEFTLFIWRGLTVGFKSASSTRGSLRRPPQIEFIFFISISLHFSAGNSILLLIFKNCFTHALPLPPCVPTIISLKFYSCDLYYFYCSKKKQQVGEVGMFAGGGCTLPRHWGGVPPTARTPYQTVVPIRGVPVLPPEPAPHVPMAAAGAGTDPSPQTPLMANKRESQV